MIKKLRPVLLEADRRLLQYKTYEDYLDALGSIQDECYLASMECSRTVAELGYRSSGETLTREQFEKKLASILLFLYPPYEAYVSHSEGFTHGDPLQVELAMRERPNRLGTISTIIFLKFYTKAGFEISGYIDYAERLVTEDWRPFLMVKKIMPRYTDLGYYHWRAGRINANDSLNYFVTYDDQEGILYQNNFDRKKINPAPGSNPGEHTTKKRIYSEMYEVVILFDHVVRQRV